MKATEAMSKLTAEVLNQTGVNLAFVTVDITKFNSIFRAWYRTQEISLQDAVEQVTELLMGCYSVVPVYPEGFTWYKV